MEKFDETKRQALIKKHAAESRHKQLDSKYKQDLKSLEASQNESKQSAEELTKFRLADLIPFVFIGRRLERYQRYKKAEARQAGLTKTINSEKAQLESNDK
jgi:ubiquitin